MGGRAETGELMKYKSTISIRVGERTELDLKFARWIENLPEDAVLSDEIKKCCVMNVELQREQSEIKELKERISRQDSILRELEAKFRAGVVIENKEEQQKLQDIDESKRRKIQELAAKMTDW